MRFLELTRDVWFYVCALVAGQCFGEVLTHDERDFMKATIKCDKIDPPSCHFVFDLASRLIRLEANPLPPLLLSPVLRDVIGWGMEDDL